MIYHHHAAHDWGSIVHHGMFTAMTHYVLHGWFFKKPYAPAVPLLRAPSLPRAPPRPSSPRAFPLVRAFPPQVRVAVDL